MSMDESVRAARLRQRYQELTDAYRSLEALLEQAGALTRAGHAQYTRGQQTGTGLPVTTLDQVLHSAGNRSEQRVEWIEKALAPRSGSDEES